MSKKKLKFEGFLATQGMGRGVVMIRATAAEVAEIAAIERLARDEGGHAIGFQRPQVAGHIREIKAYLEQEDAVLPNPLVLAFVDSARIIRGTGAQCTLEVTVSDRPPGFVVDGQQRLTALTQTGRDDFQVFASCLICKDMEELRRQFILINNTRPLPKSLIYELLPGVEELPERLTSRALAAALTEKLNFSHESSLRHQVKMQTNPTGVIKDTALQKAILNSEAAGAVQVLMSRKSGLNDAEELLSNFFAAVQAVFPDAWSQHKPTSSRLVHGAGVVAMGFVMDEIYAKSHSSEVDAFVDGLKPLVGKTAWTDGHWHFSDGEQIAWNRIEYTPRQVQLLAEHLVSLVRHAKPTRRARKSA
jgi:DGQHR domain-containing protein